MTREITRRGLANIQPGVPPDSSNQHFAIVLDREILSVSLAASLATRAG